MSCPGRELLVLLSFITRDHATQTQTAPGTDNPMSGALRSPPAISNGKACLSQYAACLRSLGSLGIVSEACSAPSSRLQPCLALIRGCARREERMQPNALGGYRYP